ncbi:MAG: GrpE protein [Actinomycetia bacterium]|nr:GrpE protein [Actinomycetes bacterium]MDQ1658572.1 molecular chaperone GrpE [Cryptosporangiaceae bacterium]
MSKTNGDSGDRGEEQPKVVIRDRRRIDPETGAARPGARPAGQSAGRSPGAATSGAAAMKKIIERKSSEKKSDDDKAGGEQSGAPSKADLKEAEALRSELEERTLDLQRVTAEYANYRKRVDRDRLAVVEQATGAVLTTLLPVLDDIDRARAHGDLTGAFAAVAEQLQNNLNKLGLTPFGEVGDVFDPMYHEAVMHTTSADVTEPTCVDVLRKGYALGERLLRAAMVAVADPEAGAPVTDG